MSLRLIITRHAKSAWDTPASGDHARPLNDRGRKAAEKLGAWLAEQGHIPDAVLSSDAARTRETWSLMAHSLPPITPVILRDLYLAPAQTMLDCLRQHGSGETLLILGHNPGIAMFAQMLASNVPAHQGFVDYPTGATTVLNFGIDDWNSVSRKSGCLQSFVVPREL